MSVIEFSKSYIFLLLFSKTGDGIHWRQIETIELQNSGSVLGFGIVGGRNSGVIVKTILPGGAADVVSHSQLLYDAYRCIQVFPEGYCKIYACTQLKFLQ